MRSLRNVFNVEYLFQGIVAMSGYLLIAAVAMIFIFIFQQAWPVFEYVSLWEFLSGSVWQPVTKPPTFGILPFLMGSFFIVGWSLIVGIPLGFASAVYLAELAPRRLRDVARPMIALLAGVPSVVYGILGLLVVSPYLARLLNLPTGLTGLTAGTVLGIMIVPTVVALSEESLLSVPDDYREAALALGATPFQAFWTVVVPAARPGLLAALMLAGGRALGETMTVLMVAGGRLAVPTRLAQPMRTMTALLASEINNAPQGGLQYSALFAVGAVLFVMTFIITTLVDYVMNHKGEG